MTRPRTRSPSSSPSGQKNKGQEKYDLFENQEPYWGGNGPDPGTQPGNGGFSPPGRSPGAPEPDGTGADQRIPEGEKTALL